jgi:hypothetical protein
MSRRNTETIEIQPGSRIWTPDQARLYRATARATSSIITEALTTSIDNNGSYEAILRTHSYARAALLAIRLRSQVERIRTTDQLGTFQMPFAARGYTSELLRKHLIDPEGPTYDGIETTVIPDLLLITDPDRVWATLNGRRGFAPGVVANFPKQLTLPKRDK